MISPIGSSQCIDRHHGHHLDHRSNYGRRTPSQSHLQAEHATDPLVRLVHELQRQRAGRSFKVGLVYRSLGESAPAFRREMNPLQAGTETRYIL